MIVSVVITYNPDSIAELLTELARQSDHVIVVDNGSQERSLAGIRKACAAICAELVELGYNAGIAAAQNRGIERARALGSPYVIFFDHDSLPAPDMTAKLLEAIEEDHRIAAVGPLPAEEREGADELVYVDRGWSPKRASKEELSRDRLDAAFLIASGCLIRMSALDSIGPMREELFIDHVDLEWGVRARNKGWRLVAVPSARLHHSLGDEVVKLPGREQPVHVHAPIRNYYIARNTIEMIHHGNMPWRWRIRYSYWCIKYVLFNSLAVDRRRERTRLLARGLGDGLRGKLGPYAPR